MNGFQEAKGTQKTESTNRMKGLKKIASVFGLAAGMALIAPQAMASAHSGTSKTHSVVQKASMKRAPLKKASTKKVSLRKASTRKVSKIASGPASSVETPNHKTRVSRTKISTHPSNKTQVARKVAKKKVSAQPRNKKKSSEPAILESFEQS